MAITEAERNTEREETRDWSALSLALAMREMEDDEVDLDDTSEDAALWAAVQANQAYKTRHPNDVIIHESGEAFLAATADL